MKLKDYQKTSLATLREFFEEARVSGPGAMSVKGRVTGAHRCRRVA